jgi:dolichol-phosphate mannosyltransferase
MLACSFGAIANVGVATYLFERDTVWPIAAIVGVLIGAVWNFTTTTVYIWNNDRRSS